MSVHIPKKYESALSVKEPKTGSFVSPKIFSTTQAYKVGVTWARNLHILLDNFLQLYLYVIITFQHMLVKTWQIICASF